MISWFNTSPKKTLALIGVAVFLLPIVLALTLVIWLPDVYSGKVHTLATSKSKDGHDFELVHYWNHGDFYNLDLLHKKPDGTTNRVTIDGDTPKIWIGRITLNEAAHTVKVSFPALNATYDWSTETLTRWYGGPVMAR